MNGRNELSKENGSRLCRRRIKFVKKSAKNTKKTAEKYETVTKR
jgi:hypothetical protein